MARRSDQVAAWLARPGRPPRRRGDRHARQPGRAVGVDARDHQARRGDHADDHRGRARPTSSTGSTAAARGSSSCNPVDAAQVRRGARRLPPARGRAAASPPDGWATSTRIRGSTCRRPSTRAPRPTTGCCSTSPPAPRRGPSSSSTPRCPTPSGTSRRCTGSACEPGDVHLEHLLARLGQARVVVLLRAVDRRGDDLPLQLHALRRGRAARPAPRRRGHLASARRRRCGGCSSTPTSPAARARCAR